MLDIFVQKSGDRKLAASSSFYYGVRSGARGNCTNGTDDSIAAVRLQYSCSEAAMQLLQSSSSSDTIDNSFAVYILSVKDSVHTSVHPSHGLCKQPRQMKSCF